MKKQDVTDVLKGVLQTQVMIFAIALVSIFGLVGFAWNDQLRLAKQRDRALVTWHLRDVEHRTVQVSESAALSSDLYRDIVLAQYHRVKSKTADVLSSTYGFEVVEIYSPGGAVIASTRADSARPFLLHGDRIMDAAPFAAAERRAAGAEDPPATNTSFWLRQDDNAYFISLAPIVPPDIFNSPNLPRRTFWLMVADRLDDTALRPLSTRYQLEDLTIKLLPQGSRNNEIEVVDVDGEIIGTIAWNSRPPGHDHLMPLFLLAGFGLLALFLLGWHTTLRTAAEIDTLHRWTRSERALLRSVFDHSNDSLLVLDAMGIIRDCNKRVCRRSGYDRDELIGKNCRLWLPGLPLDDEGLVDGEDGYETTVTIKDGSEVPVDIRVGRLGEADRQRFIVSLRDISERVRAEEKIWHKAHFDPLTDLPNRALFGSELNGALSHCREQNTASGLMFIDLDGFKEVNDTLGHDAGDMLLIQVAERFRALVDGDKVVARLGGDEFAVLLPDLPDEEQAVALARILNSELAKPYRLPQGEARISASIGIALAPRDGVSASALLKAADHAMYDAKRCRRGRYSLATRHHAHGHHANKRATARARQRSS